jgi:hypothetical protein
MRIPTLIILLMAGTFFVQAQTDAEKVRATISKNDIEAHIYFLASDELKGRATGSPEIDIAASYLANHLRRFGVKPAGDDGSYYQQVKLEKVSPPESIEMTMKNLNLSEFINLKVSNMEFEGDAIFLGYGTEDDFSSNDVKGKLVLVLAGQEGETEMMQSYRAGRKKRDLANSGGAVALVEIVNLSDSEKGRMAHHFNEPRVTLGAKDEEPEFVHLWGIPQADADLSKLKKGAEKTAVLSIRGISTENMGGKNVLGYLEGSDPELKDEFVIYSAHYDHVGVGKPNAEMDSIYNGARDNAVGTVTVMNAAENIGKYPTKRSSLFIFFTGEEKGLLGSEYFVENPTIALDKVVYCFNSDNGGYNDTSKTTIIGLHRTTASQHFIDAAKEFGLTAIDDPAPEQGLFDRSDNVHFAKKGVPAPTYCMGFNAFDEEITKYYHQVTDNPNTLDYDYLYKFFQSYVLSARLIANDPERPFWTEGDKYYEAGKKLYAQKKEEATILD